MRWCGGCVCVRACVCCNACVAPRLNPHSSHPSHLTSHIPHPHILTSPPLTPHPSPTHPHTLARHKNRATQAQRSSCVNISTTPTNHASHHDALDLSIISTPRMMSRLLFFATGTFPLNLVHLPIHSLSRPSD